MTGFTRRELLQAGLASVALGATGQFGLTEAASAAGTPAIPYLSYTADSYFRTSVAGHPFDAAATGAFRAFMRAHPDQRSRPYPYINGLAGNRWGTAYAEGSSGDPVWSLTGAVPKEVAVLETQGLHAPAWLGSMLSGTVDSPFVVMDRGFGISVWGAKARVVAPYRISVSSAGMFEHESNGLDRRNPRSDSSLNFRSRGAIPDAMVIRRDRMDYAIANGTGLGHVLHLFFVETDTDAGYCHPMIGCESDKRGWGAEGQRIVISPTVDLTRRGMSPAGLAVARTLQQHGCYLGDNAGRGSALKAEQASPARNPWQGLEFNQRSLAGITWDDFVVLPKGW